MSSATSPQAGKRQTKKVYPDPQGYQATLGWDRQNMHTAKCSVCNTKGNQGDQNPIKKAQGCGHQVCWQCENDPSRADRRGRNPLEAHTRRCAQCKDVINGLQQPQGAAAAQPAASQSAAPDDNANVPSGDHASGEPAADASERYFMETPGSDRASSPRVHMRKRRRELADSGAERNDNRAPPPASKRPRIEPKKANETPLEAWKRYLRGRLRIRSGMPIPPFLEPGGYDQIPMEELHDVPEWRQVSAILQDFEGAVQFFYQQKYHYGLWDVYQTLSSLTEDARQLWINWSASQITQPESWAEYTASTGNTNPFDLDDVLSKWRFMNNRHIRRFSDLLETNRLERKERLRRRQPLKKRHRYLDDDADTSAEEDNGGQDNGGQENSGQDNSGQNNSGQDDGGQGDDDQGDDDQGDDDQGNGEQPDDEESSEDSSDESSDGGDHAAEPMPTLNQPVDERRIPFAREDRLERQRRRVAGMVQFPATTPAPTLPPHMIPSMWLFQRYAPWDSNTIYNPHRF